jgi:molecular chaperone HtpG
LDGEAEEFASPFRVRSVIKKYSDHISVPVLMLEQAPPVDNDNDDEDAVPASPAWERVNEAKALWTRSRSEVSDEEYKEFYRHVSSDYQEPLSWGHNRVEGKLDYTSLLYLPSQAPFDLWNRDGARGLKLYIQRTFIMDDAEQFLPLYLRFVKGVLDSQDLPLNISREILQQSPQVDSLRSAVTKRVLDMLGKMGKSDPDKYQTFWNVFGNVLKEGPGEDFANREKIAELLRFASTDSDDDTQNVSLPSYVSRMQEGQNAIYYVVADNHVTAKNSPHIEVFRKKGIEVLLLSDRIDDWLMGHLNEFDGKALKDIAKGELDLGESTDEEKAELEAAKTDNEGLLDRLKEALGGRISEVRPTLRLTDSPACLVVGEHELGAQMRSILEAAGQELPDSQPILEVNTDHGLVKRMDSESDEDRFADLALILLDQATLAQGSQLEDPASYVSRMNRLLVEMSA